MKAAWLKLWSWEVPKHWTSFSSASLTIALSFLLMGIAASSQIVWESSASRLSKAFTILVISWVAAVAILATASTVGRSPDNRKDPQL